MTGMRPHTDHQSRLTPSTSWRIVAMRLRRPRSRVVAVGSDAGRKPRNTAEAPEIAAVLAGVVRPEAEEPAHHPRLARSIEADRQRFQPAERQAVHAPPHRPLVVEAQPWHPLHQSPQ